MILNCNFEELRALSAGAELLLADHGPSASQGPVAAPSEAVHEVRQLIPQLDGAIEIHTLAEQRMVRRAVGAICAELHERLEEKVIQFHPAHEEAVSLYFDYAHAFGVLTRLDDMGVEMAALIELMTGAPATEENARTVAFPD